ncbi:MAG TPA: hypothetical protein VN449_11135 [Gaiellaceae bacterium]|nr:hypothetical protein [Gaiellaceae bacterium]
MNVGGRRAVLAGGLSTAVLVAGPLLPGAAAKPLGPDGLTPTERSAMRIASVQAVGAEGGGLIVTVTFAGNLEKAIGRGNLKKALVAVILRPKDAQFATADLATEGAGPIGFTSKKTHSTAVGVARNGRTFTFFIAGPGSSNVKDVVVKTFASLPTRKPSGTTAGKPVPADTWDLLEKSVALDEELVTALDASAIGSFDCAALKRMHDQAVSALAHARKVHSLLQDLGKEIDVETERVQDKLGVHGHFGLIAARTIMAPIELGIRLNTGESNAQVWQSWKDLLRTLKLDARLVTEYLARNQKLIDSLNVLKGKIEGLITARCGSGGTTPPPPPATFQVGVKASYHHPGGSTSTLCVRVTTTPAQAGRSARVQVSGPGVVGPADQTIKLDVVGLGDADVTINAYGEYTVTATVTAGSQTGTATTTKDVQKTQAACPPQ